MILLTWNIFMVKICFYIGKYFLEKNFQAVEFSIGAAETARLDLSPYL
jgi:hypothetical protein